MPLRGPQHPAISPYLAPSGPQTRYFDSITAMDSLK
jgi:hypothetical protein